MSPPTAAPLPQGSKVKLSVVKGLRTGKTYVVKDGATYVGRIGPQQVDVDLSEQENPGVAVQVNRFALIWNDKNGLGIADTGRGVTSVNGTRIQSGKRIELKAEDSIQIGKTVLQLKVILKKRTAAQK